MSGDANGIPWYLAYQPFCRHHCLPLFFDIIKGHEEWQDLQDTQTDSSQALWDSKGFSLCPKDSIAMAAALGAAVQRTSECKV